MAEKWLEVSFDKCIQQLDATRWRPKTFSIPLKEQQKIPDYLCVVRQVKRECNLFSSVLVLQMNFTQ